MTKRVTRADAAVPPPAPRTFDEAFAEHRLTANERCALVWHLAAMRTRKLVETLLPPLDPRDVLRAVGEEACASDQTNKKAT